jgi:hypothetical protein
VSRCDSKDTPFERSEMTSFVARWPNGDVSFVVANTKEEACLSLDEVGDPFNVNLTPLDDKRPMAVHFKLMVDGEMELDEISESLLCNVQKALPVIDAERGRLIDEGIEPNSDAWQQRMRAAVTLEREREFGCNVEDAANRAFGYSDDESDKK